MTRTLVLASSLVATVWAAGPVSAAGEGDLAARLRAATRTLLAPPEAQRPDPRGPLVEVVAVLSSAGREAKLPADLRAGIDSAHSRLQQGASLGDPAVESGLRRAYTALNDGHAFAFPPGVTNIGGAREACLREVERASTALDQGRHREAVKAILEFLMLVTTPMEAH
jgi:hypothetical protein